MKNAKIFVFFVKCVGFSMAFYGFSTGTGFGMWVFTGFYGFLRLFTGVSTGTGFENQIYHKSG